MSNSVKERLYVGNLKDVKEILDNKGIRFWLDTGTLLGAVRDRKMIPWDNDIDLGVRKEDQEKLIAAMPLFRERGFIINQVLVPMPNSDINYPRISLYRAGFVVDIWAYYSWGESWVSFVSGWTFNKSLGAKIMSRLFWFLWLSLSGVRINVKNKFKGLAVNLVRHLLFFLPGKFRVFLTKKLRKKLAVLTKVVSVPSRFFEKLELMEYYGITFSVPSQAQDYLEYRYGKDWTTPKKKWDWVNDDASVKSLRDNYEKT